MSFGTQGNTNPRTLIPDKQRYFMPGYGGFCPKQSFFIGKTYGSATQQVMQMMPTVGGRLAPTTSVTNSNHSWRAPSRNFTNDWPSVMESPSCDIEAFDTGHRTAQSAMPLLEEHKKHPECDAGVQRHVSDTTGLPRLDLEPNREDVFCGSLWTHQYGAPVTDWDKKGVQVSSALPQRVPRPPNLLITVGDENPRPHGELYHLHPSRRNEDGVMEDARFSRGSYSFHESHILSPEEFADLQDYLTFRDGPVLEF